MIPKPIRDALGLHPGVDVLIEVRGDEVVITKPKLREPVDVKGIILKEVDERLGLYRL